jgi:glucose-6-phosphate 1-dehydrogenase
VIEPCTIVLFGASGDLTQRMVMPAIFRLVRRGLLPPAFRLIGYARSQMTDEAFRTRMRAAVLQNATGDDKAAWADFAARLSYVSGQYDGDHQDGFANLSRSLQRLDEETGAGDRRLFYLATPPTMYAPIMNNLSAARLGGRAYQPAATGWARFVIEKPFGHDLGSARALNAELAGAFDEEDIYRIDHFLGKEIVQNVFALRFANAIFEPVWNRTYIDHVQISAMETLGVEGRGGYYEGAGALRDMVQNHLLQLLALVAIEPPARWSPRDVRDEKVKVLRAVRPAGLGVGRDAVRGQYGAGVVRGKPVLSYRDEPGVAPDSSVETYAALRLHIDNVRWAGVPFYLRSGKRTAEAATEIVVQFKPMAHTPFGLGGGGHATVARNRLIASISPHQLVVLQVEGKRPGQEMELEPIDLDYCYVHPQQAADAPSAYEHLLLDAFRGDPTYFARADEVEAAWEVVEPMIQQWAMEKPAGFPDYRAGSTGPATGDELLARSRRSWHVPEPPDGGRRP